MDEETREAILKDYERANNIIFNILNGKLKNFCINEENYLNPVFSDEVVPLSSICIGRLDYFQTIRDSLENMLIFGSSVRKIPGAPDYVKYFSGRS